VDKARGLGPSNRGEFSDPALDRIIEAAVVRSDAGREAAIRHALAETVARLCMIPMYVEPTIAATRGGIVYHPRVDQQMVAQAAVPAGK
jgi:peptide/nickel transport system substrate-binding protein